MKEIIVRIKRCKKEDISERWKKEGIKEAYEVAWGEKGSIIANANCRLSELIRKVKEEEGEI